MVNRHGPFKRTTDVSSVTARSGVVADTRLPKHAHMHKAKQSSAVPVRRMRQRRKISMTLLDDTAPMVEAGTENHQKSAPHPRFGDIKEY